MENKKFLGNEYVTVVRYFDYAGTLKVAVKDYTGKVFVVNASELSHAQNTSDGEVAESVSEPVSKVEDDEVVVKSPESTSEDTQETVEPEPEPELEVQEETVSDSEPVESGDFKVITATNIKTGEETELISERGLANFATEHELDLDVIDRVLAGEQKTHKGFEFK